MPGEQPHGLQARPRQKPRSGTVGEDCSHPRTVSPIRRCPSGRRRRGGTCRRASAASVDRRLAGPALVTPASVRRGGSTGGRPSGEPGGAAQRSRWRRRATLAARGSRRRAARRCRRCGVRVAEPGVAVGIRELLHLEKSVCSGRRRRVEELVVERIEHPQRLQQRGSLRPHAALNTLQPRKVADTAGSKEALHPVRSACRARRDGHRRPSGGAVCARNAAARGSTPVIHSRTGRVDP